MNTALQSVFFGTTPKRTVVCNQSFTKLKPPKVNTALQSVFLGTKPKWTVARNQFSNDAKILEGEYSSEIGLLWYET